MPAGSRFHGGKAGKWWRLVRGRMGRKLSSVPAGLVGGKAPRAVVVSPLVWRNSDRSLAVRREPGCRGWLRSRKGASGVVASISMTAEQASSEQDPGHRVPSRRMSRRRLAVAAPTALPSGAGLVGNGDPAAFKRGERKSRLPYGSEARLLGRSHEAKASARK